MKGYSIEWVSGDERHVGTYYTRALAKSYDFEKGARQCLQELVRGTSGPISAAAVYTLEGHKLVLKL